MEEQDARTTLRDVTRAVATGIVPPVPSSSPASEGYLSEGRSEGKIGEGMNESLTPDYVCEGGGTEEKKRIRSESFSKRGLGVGTLRTGIDVEHLGQMLSELNGNLTVEVNGFGVETSDAFGLVSDKIQDNSSFDGSVVEIEGNLDIKMTPLKGQSLIPTDLLSDYDDEINHDEDDSPFFFDSGPECATDNKQDKCVDNAFLMEEEIQQERLHGNHIASRHGYNPGSHLTEAIRKASEWTVKENIRDNFDESEATNENINRNHSKCPSPRSKNNSNHPVLDRNKTPILHNRSQRSKNGLYKQKKNQSKATAKDLAVALFCNKKGYGAVTNGHAPPAHQGHYQNRVVRNRSCSLGSDNPKETSLSSSTSWQPCFFQERVLGGRPSSTGRPRTGKLTIRPPLSTNPLVTSPASRSAIHCPLVAPLDAPTGLGTRAPPSSSTQQPWLTSPSSYGHCDDIGMTIAAHHQRAASTLAGIFEMSEQSAASALEVSDHCPVLARLVVEQALNLPPVCRHLLGDGCYRSDCSFSHDVEGHTCLFWLRGRCGKGAMRCRFLHGFANNVIKAARSDLPDDYERGRICSTPIATGNLLTHNRNMVQDTILRQSPRGENSGSRSLDSGGATDAFRAFSTAYSATMGRKKFCEQVLKASSSEGKLNCMILPGTSIEQNENGKVISRVSSPSTGIVKNAVASSFSFASVALKGYKKSESFSSSTEVSVQDLSLVATVPPFSAARYYKSIKVPSDLLESHDL